MKFWIKVFENLTSQIQLFGKYYDFNNCYKFCSSKMAATPVKEIQREEKIWICGSTERGYASRACEKDHPRSW